MRTSTGRRVLGATACLLLLLVGCGKPSGQGGEATIKKLRVFHAAGMTPVLEAIREDCERDIGIALVTEGSGSQVACRKVAELGRPCDLVMVADSALVAQLLKGYCSWRIDFARDEVVLGVGQRAPLISEAEEDWPSVLVRHEVRIGRVDENQGPIGYRALLVWKLQENLGNAGLSDKLTAKCDKIVDDVSRLTPLLKTGEIDYAFVYRSICIAHDIRYIELDPRVNLGSTDVDYSGASVSFRKGMGREAEERITVTGAPIVWALSIPDRDAAAETARAFVAYLMTKRGEVLDRNGFRPLRPARFHGPPGAFPPFEEIARREGTLE